MIGAQPHDEQLPSRQVVAAREDVEDGQQPRGGNEGAVPEVEGPVAGVHPDLRGAARIQELGRVGLVVPGEVLHRLTVGQEHRADGKVAR